VGLVNRGEPSAQPDRRHRGPPVHATTERFLDTGLGVGVQALTEESLHMRFADLTVHTHGCETGPDPAPRRVAGRRVVVGQSLSTSALVITRGDLTGQVGIAVASVKNMHGHQRDHLLR